tara:strand:+ start:1249 stop:1449 length:201 start_codon:yes stop_codon:yes gene_type:complete
MARPKKKIQKREVVFNKISDAIDYLQSSWYNLIKVVFITSMVLFTLWLALVWMPTVENIYFEIRYY